MPASHSQRQVHVSIAGGKGCKLHLHHSLSFLYLEGAAKGLQRHHRSEACFFIFLQPKTHSRQTQLKMLEMRSSRTYIRSIMKVDWKFQNSNRIIPAARSRNCNLLPGASGSPLQCSNLATDGHQLGKMSLTVERRSWRKKYNLVEEKKNRLLKPAADTFNYNFKVKICYRSDVHALVECGGNGMKERWFEICQLFSSFAMLSRAVASP